MFILTQYLLKSFLDSKISNTSLSTYTIVIGIAIYALFYSYFMMYNRELLPFFNRIIIYIIGIDLLLSAFYNYNVQLQNVYIPVSNQNLLEIDNSVSESDIETDDETDDDEENEDEEIEDEENENTGEDEHEEELDEEKTNSDVIPQLYEEKIHQSHEEESKQETNQNLNESCQENQDDLTDIIKDKNLLTVSTESQVKKRGRPSKKNN